MTEQQNGEEGKPVLPVNWTGQDVHRNSPGDWTSHIYGYRVDLPGRPMQYVARIEQSGARPAAEAEAIMRLLGSAERMMLALKAAMPVLEWAERMVPPPPEFADDGPWKRQLANALSEVREVLADIEESGR